MHEMLWQSNDQPKFMMRQFRDLREEAASDRKLRLLACSCCRMVWDSLEDPHLRSAVSTGEQYADGTCDAQELQTAHIAARSACMKINLSILYPKGMGANAALSTVCSKPWEA